MNSRSDISGVTLIEMIVAICIIGILAAVAVPKMSPMVELIKLRSAANSIKRQMIIARTRALSDPNKHVGVYIDRTTNPHSSFVFIDLFTQNQYDATCPNCDPIYMGIYKMPNGIRDSIPPGGDNAVFFRGDGSAKAPENIIVVNKYGRILTISIVASTGRVKVQ